MRLPRHLMDKLLCDSCVVNVPVPKPDPLRRNFSNLSNEEVEEHRRQTKSGLCVNVYPELEAEYFGEGAKLMGLQLLQLELRLERILLGMAATQTTNNNLIKSILDKEKLNGSNFLDWYRNLRIVLGNEQKLHHLEEVLPEAPPATATAAVRNAYTQKSIPKKAPDILAIRQGQIQKPKLQARGKGKKKGKDWTLEEELSSIFRKVEEEQSQHGLKGYRKLNKGALDLYVGNGNSAAIKTIWSFDLILPSGMILELDNFSKDNVFYFNAIPRDVIFEIDMHNHISNERSIYTCINKKSKHNLDSTFLWHCRLGHINKKRIVKLQHDGLLESIDDESFNVCVSCISRKMARNPFTFASERADDLLGIIHSDVCGPFRTTSREGANYYVTFTDDFSRYGYVYLIKHKHEVFEMFKTFQNEVENQLEKTIKALRSDRGGEYLSQEFLDHLKSHGIILQLTPPYTPQHNSVSTRIPQEAPKRYGFYIDAEEHDLGDHVDLPPNCKTVRSKWLFKKKTDMDGNTHTYKARLVAKDFTQTYGVDYEETFSPVADIKAIRILIAIAAYSDYEIWKMDVKIAFLNGHLNEDVYMVQPEGFVYPKHPRRVCKLQRSIYGLKQASRSWNKRFDEEIKKYGFT
ncbi:retrotransposon protein, putative, ty1-copia subclass [Tanacetum coccineum]